MTTKQAILQLFQTEKNILSGEMIAQKLAVSRTAVWKAIKSLEKEGHRFNHLPQGYQYLPSDVLVPQFMATAPLTAANIHVFDETTSTMHEAKLGAAQHATTPALYIADQQTGGHGRFQRPFFSPQGQIYMSLLLEPKEDFSEMPQYTLLTAVAVAQAIDAVTGKSCDIKWVNDIYLEGKKVCGILSEATADVELGRITNIIIGMGLNFSIPPETFPEAIQQKATSLFKGTQPDITRNALIQLIWQNFFQLLANPKDTSYLDIYREKSFVLGKTVSFSQNGTTFTGTAQTITDTGELIVTTPQGEKVLSSGEISLQSIE